MRNIQSICMIYSKSRVTWVFSLSSIVIRTAGVDTVGGSGAPRWTLDIAGLNCKTFSACGSALVQAPRLDQYTEPGTLWATNYCKFACNTMFTLFFAGEIFAPYTTVHNENIGNYLRRKYVECFTRVAQSLQDVKGLIGIDAMNEPHPGFIGLQSLGSKFDEDTLLHLGEMLTALHSMKLAAGIAQSIPVYTRFWPRPTRATSHRMFDPAGTSVWKDGFSDIWRSHGVWSENTHIDTYFATFPSSHKRSGERINFNQDCYIPFLQYFNRYMKAVLPDACLFAEPVPNSRWDSLSTFSNAENVCFAPHWYDLKALFEKKFSSRLTFNVQALSRGSRNFVAHLFWL